MPQMSPMMWTYLMLIMTTTLITMEVNKHFSMKKKW